VHYHFSTKDALLDEVLHLVGDDVVADIAHRAEELDRSESRPSGREVLDAIFESYHDLLARQGQRGAWWIQLVDRYLGTDPDRVTNGSAQPPVDAATQRAFPDADPGAVRTALGVSVRLYVAELARIAPALVEGTAGDEDRRHLALMRTYVSGGLDATLSQPLHLA
jgi:AcrR family transcriptional regulator